METFHLLLNIHIQIKNNKIIKFVFWQTEHKGAVGWKPSCCVIFQRSGMEGAGESGCERQVSAAEASRWPVAVLSLLPPWKGPVSVQVTGWGMQVGERKRMLRVNQPARGSLPPYLEGRLRTPEAAISRLLNRIGGCGE